MKILFIDSWDNVGNFFRTQRNKLDIIHNVGLYSSKSIINKFFRLLGRKVFKPFMYFSYGKWKKEIDNYDMFIIESRKSFEYAIQLIKKKCPEKRLIVWYWNEITSREMTPDSIINLYGCEAWTFDKKEAKRFNIKYNDTYYFSNLKEDKEIENDVFYVGIDREGRIEKLNKLSSKFEENQIKYRFNLTISPIKKKDNNYRYKKRLSYSEVIEEIKKSNVILDLTKQTQYGLTLRPMEAMFFRKKLITDNKNIIEYDFYNKNNIFILDVDDINEISNFINSPYEDQIDENIKSKYMFENWLNRIINNKSLEVN